MISRMSLPGDCLLHVTVLFMLSVVLALSSGGPPDAWQTSSISGSESGPRGFKDVHGVSRLVQGKIIILEDIPNGEIAYISSF